MNWDIVHLVAGLYLLLGSFLTTTNHWVAAVWFRAIPGILGTLLVVRYLSLIGAL